MQKFSVKKVVLIVSINAALQVMWIAYNSYVPLYLQGGNVKALGEGASGILGFGLNPGMTGFIMTLDNIMALFIAPFVGMMSDSSKSRLGRRMPFLLFPMPIMVLAIMAIGIIPNMIPPESNGNLGMLVGLFIPFLLALLAVLVGNAFMDSPKSALLYDWTPSSRRTMATGISILIATVTTIVVAVTSSMVYDTFKPLLFILAGAVLAVAVLLVFFLVKDAPTPSEVTEQGLTPGKIIGVIRSLPKDHSRSLSYFIASLFFAYLAIAIIQTFLTSYAVSVVGMDAGSAGMLMAVFAVGGAIMALPAAWLAGKFGRRLMMIIGFGIMVLSSVLIMLVPSQSVLMVIMVTCAIGWIMGNVGQTPMMAEHAPSDTYLATFISMMAIISTLSNIVGPNLGGWIVQWAGNNYVMIWPVVVVCLIIAALMMIPVTHGEVKQEVKKSEEEVQTASID